MLRQMAQRAPLQPLPMPQWERRGVAAPSWRLDQIDSAAPGNKIFKPEQNFRAARAAGYACVQERLAQFVDGFRQRTALPIEPVYSGKMLYAIHRRIERGDFVRGTRILALHTGGLQGARGFDYRNNQQRENTAFHSICCE